MTATTAATTAQTIAKKAMSKRIYNFSAGPAVLPDEVLRQAQQDIWDIDGSGIGILEHSHRGPVFDRVIAEAEEDCRRVANISDDYAVLFLPGGATLQFTMIPMNFLTKDATADYADTGVWTTKAIKAAKPFGHVHLAFEGAKHKYDHTPDDSELSLTPGAVYFHYCTNNTIYGTRYPKTPASQHAPLVADMSSDIFSRPVEIDRHALIYAGAQKNLGPSGIALVIIRKDFMARGNVSVPDMLDYRKHAENGSRLNTPPAFGIYVMGQVFKWILKQGGLPALAKRNDEKAKLIYDAIDGSNGFYRGVSQPKSRSMMNITFRLPNEALEKAFVSESAKQEMDGLKGHRDAGGIRASIYNAFPKAGCEALAQFMREFARRNG